MNFCAPAIFAIVATMSSQPAAAGAPALAVTGASVKPAATKGESARHAARLVRPARPPRAAATTAAGALLPLLARPPPPAKRRDSVGAPAARLTAPLSPPLSLLRPSRVRSPRARARASPPAASAFATCSRSRSR